MMSSQVIEVEYKTPSAPVTERFNGMARVDNDGNLFIYGPVGEGLIVAFASGTWLTIRVLNPDDIANEGVDKQPAPP
jgi:hypothetical protein